MNLREVIARGLQRWPPERLCFAEEATAFCAYVRAEAEASEAQILRRLQAVERAYGISLGLPVRLMRIKRAQPMRRADWADHAAQIFAADAALERCLMSRRGTPEAFAARALAQAILRGGLLRPETWPAFWEALASGQALQRCAALGEMVWLTLTLPRAQGRVAQTEAQEVLRYYPDAVTLGLMARARGAQASVGTSAACLAHVARELGLASLSLTAVREAGYAALEDRAAHPIPQVLFEISRGAVPSFSVMPVHWEAALTGQGAALQFAPPVRGTPPDAAVAIGVELSLLRFRGALATIDSEASKRSARPVQAALERLLVERPVPVVRALALWVLDLLKRKRAVSTVLRYGAALAPLLGPAFGAQELAHLEAGEIETRVEDVLETVPARERIYRAARMAQFFQFASLDPRLSWPEARFEVEGGALPRVRTALVTGAEVARALTRFSGDMLSQAAVLLAARGGLRLSDMEALRVGDVSLEGEGWVMIHQTRWGDLKSSSARRKVPLRLMLTAAEDRIWSRFVVSRRAAGQPEAPLLAQVIGFGQIARFDRQSFAARLAGLGMRPHGLRHGALSNLALVLLAPEAARGEITALTGWKKDAQVRIRAFLTMGDPLYGPRSLARLAGHRDPSTTFETYIHMSDLALGLHVRAADSARPVREVARILGVNAARLSRPALQSCEASRGRMLDRLTVEEITAAPAVPEPQPPRLEALTVDHVLRLLDQRATGANAVEVSQVQGAPLAVVNALARAKPVTRLRTKADGVAAVALARRIVRMPEPEVWAKQALRAPMCGIVLGSGSAADWAVPLDGIIRFDIERLTGPRHRVIPIAPSGARGMRLLRSCAQIVIAWLVAERALAALLERASAQVACANPAQRL